MKQETPVQKSAHAEKITSKYAHADEASYTSTSKDWVDWSGLGEIFANWPKFTLCLMPWNVGLEGFQEQDMLWEYAVSSCPCTAFISTANADKLGLSSAP